MYSKTFGTIIEMRDISIYKCIYIFIISFMTDTYAYIGGMLIGKHKLIPAVSPKKSVEGSIAGSLVGTAIVSSYYINVLDGNMDFIINAIVNKDISDANLKPWGIYLKNWYRNKSGLDTLNKD